MPLCLCGDFSHREEIVHLLGDFHEAFFVAAGDFGGRPVAPAAAGGLSVRLDPTASAAA